MTLMLPVYTPGGRLAGFTMTLRLAGEVPVLGATESQVSPAGFVVAVAVKFSGVLKSVLVNEMFCEIGAVPGVATTLMTAGLSVINGVVLAFNVTGMVIGAEPGAAMVTVPVQVCGVVMPEVFTLSTTWDWTPD